MKLRFILPSLALLSITCHAANYYINPEGGSDAANGTSTSTPWQHCPGDTNATATAAGTTLTAGDVVTFKGATSYTDTINLNWSGTAGNPITYDGNSSGAWGTGKAIFNGLNSISQNSTNKLYGFYGVGRSNLVFRSLEVTKWGGRGDLPRSCADNVDRNGWGIALYGSRAIKVQDSYFHEIGDWGNQANNNGNDLGIGVLFDYWSAGNTVTNCEFTKIGGACVRIQTYTTGLYATNNLVIDSRFHDYIRWGVDVASASANAQISDIIIDRCQFYNYYQYDASTWLGCPGLWPHCDPIIMRLGNFPPVGGQTLGTTTQPNIIRNCYWYNDTPVQYSAGTAGIFLTTWGGRLLVYNNVFNNVLMHGEGGIYAQDGTDPATNPNARPDYYLANNTFFGDTYAIMLRSVSGQTYALTNGSIRILNNALYKTDDSAAVLLSWGLDGFSSPTKCDYNRYYHPNRSEMAGYIFYAGAGHYADFASMQAHGWEAHGSYGNPLFEDVTHGLGTQSSLNLFPPQFGSQLIGSATNISALFSTDKNGYPRGLSWDIGAYENLSPPIPVNLQITGSAQFTGDIQIR